MAPVLFNILDHSLDPFKAGGRAQLEAEFFGARGRMWDPGDNRLLIWDKEDIMEAKKNSLEAREWMSMLRMKVLPGKRMWRK